MSNQTGAKRDSAPVQIELGSARSRQDQNLNNYAHKSNRNTSRFVYESQVPQFTVGGNKQKSNNFHYYNNSTSRVNNISVQKNQSKAREISRAVSDNNINIQKNDKGAQMTKSLSMDTRASTNSSGIKIEKKSDGLSEKKTFTILAKTDNVKNEQCPYCELISLQYAELMEHILKRHKLLNSFIENKCPGNVCQKCTIKFSDENELISHFLKVHEIDLLIFLRDNIPEQFDCKKENIKNFIEKHAPSLNTSYKRDYEISDSDYSDLSVEEDKNFEDNEYMAFISSSINTDGISTERKLDPSNFVTNNNVNNLQSNQSIESFLNELNEYEIYLRTKGLVYFDKNDCFCEICKKRFDTSIRMIKHCYDQHKIRITQELRRTLYYLSLSDLSQANDKALLQMPELRLELTLYPPVKQPENPRISLMMNVPIIFSDFFLETLSVNLPESLQHITPKVFHQPLVIMSKIPVPIPILFKQGTQINCTAFGFMNTPIATAEKINEIVGSILDVLSTKPLYCVTFKYLDACPKAFQLLDSICEKYGFKGLITPKLIDNETNTYSFKFYLMFTRNTNDDLNAIKNEINNFVKGSEMGVCKRCKELFNTQINGDFCTGPKSTLLKLQLKKTKHDLESIASSFQIEKLTLGNLI